MAGRLSVEGTDVRLCNLETRFPFEFGIVTMRGLPHCFVSVDVEVGGTETTGLAADHFPPKWLTKNPDRSLESEAKDMLEVVEQACAHAADIEGATVFDCWRQVYEAQREWAADTDHPPLLWGFGVTFVERAIIDAFCRATDTTFATAVRDGEFGIEPGYVYSELDGHRVREHLPSTAKRSLRVRHTVGHGDPLRDRPDDGPDDDLPLTLVENVETYGFDRFKIKLGGDVETDVRRFRDVLDVLSSTCADFAFTLDANEQYDSVADLRETIDRVRGHHDLEDKLLFVEQPFPRGRALSESITEPLANWTDRPPVIIDESDGELETFGRALDAGYDGTSYKNCKGVVKGLVNACLAATRRDRGETAIVSGEDLTTIGPVSLQQDLAAMATIGIDHVERNGHHYFRGLEMFDWSVQSAVLSAHGDLYRRLPDGTATVDIENGRVDLDSVSDAPFGYACDVDPRQFDSPREWEFSPLAE